MSKQIIIHTKPDWNIQNVLDRLHDILPEGTEIEVSDD